MIWTVIGYGAEIQGGRRERRWRGYKGGFEIDVNERTPGYLVREELRRELMRSRTARKTWGFEKRLEKGREGVDKEMLGRDKKKGRKG